MASELYVGLMSGTSLDGIDCALVRIRRQNKIETLASDFMPLPEELKSGLAKLSILESIHVQALGQAQRDISLLSAELVLNMLQKAGVLPSEVRAIGAHGVTIRHLPELPMTWQIGDPSLLAHLTGIDVISDLRSADMAAGGQGAPLVPGFHQAVFNHPERDRVVLNLGGIANVSVLRSSAPILGFDTGPANTLLNLWCQKHLEQDYDANGNWARNGQLLPRLLDQLLGDPYFKLAPPKSTGKERFNLAWLEACIDSCGANEALAVDVQTTLTHLTAKSVALAISEQMDKGELIVCGGGVHNQFLLECLQAYLPAWWIVSSADFGVSPDDMEAMAFAWLAYNRVHDLPAGMPDCTGAERSKILGAWHKA